MAYFDYNGKKIYYQELGSGTPCVFLHGNTASSKMFEFLLPLYRDDMKIILIDFLGNGKSDRLASFPEEMWIDQGHQIVELCRNLNCGKVNLIGTSGGAYAAINAALEMPELFRKVVADSFDGSTLPAGFGDGIIRERQAAKRDEQARGFYEWCQGDEMLANDMEAECRRLHEANPDISYHVFDTGGHPLIATRAEEIARIIKEFLCDD